MLLQCVSCVKDPTPNNFSEYPTKEIFDTPEKLEGTPEESPGETPEPSAPDSDQEAETPVTVTYPAPVPILLPDIKDSDNYKTINNKLSWRWEKDRRYTKEI